MSDARQLPTWLPRVATAAALLAMVAYSFWQRWSVLSASPFPLGVDGYFYPIQLRSLLETGALEYPASPLAFWLLAPFAAATDPITGTKLGTALLTALIALPAYGIGAELGKGRGPGLVAAALATFSAGSFYLTIEFVKNGIGITVALAALWLVLRALSVPTRRRVALALAGIAAALLAHKMAAGLVLLIAIPAAIGEARARGALRGRRLLMLVGLAGATLIAALVIGIVAPRRFLSPGDLRLLDGLFAWDATFAVLETPRGTIGLGHEPLVAFVLGIAGALALVIDRRRWSAGPRVVAWSAVGLALFVGWPFLAVDDPQGLGMRLRIIAFVPSALCAAIVLRSLLAHTLPLVATQARAATAITCGALAAILVLYVPGTRTEGRVVVEAHMATAAYALAGRIPAGDTAIVPERHIAFMVQWYADVAIAIRPEQVPIDRRWRVIPGAFIGRRSALARALIAVRDRRELPPPIGLNPRDPNGLVLVPEVTWQYLVTRLPADERVRFAAWPTI